MPDRACVECKRIVKSGTECPICKGNDLTTAWKGLIIIYDPEHSELAEQVGVDTPGSYAIRVKG